MNPQEVLLNHYFISPETITRISMGLINETYKVEAGKESYIFQKLHPIFDWRMAANVALVGQFLNSQGMISQQTIPTGQSKEWAVPDGERWWRLLTFIPGLVIEKIDLPELTYEAGKILGKFHTLGKKYDGFLHQVRFAHDTLSHYSRFLEAACRNDTRSIGEMVYLVKKSLPEFLLPYDLSRTLTHGDPKISNFIFHFETNQAVALIDFDICSRQNNIVVELGDAFRSWCGGWEDDPNNSFDLEKFKAGWKGYLEGVKDGISEEEKALLPQAIKLIILELASRFLRDYFEDNYFGWNAQKYTSRREHNLARAKGQLTLYRDFLEKEVLVRAFVSRA